MGIQQTLTAPGSPWQNPFVERLIGSIRRECLDRVIVLNEQLLRRIHEDYFDYYYRVCPHQSLMHDSPIPRPVESPDYGKVIEMPKVGGLASSVSPASCLRERQQLNDAEAQRHEPGPAPTQILLNGYFPEATHRSSDSLVRLSHHPTRSNGCFFLSDGHSATHSGVACL